MIKPYLKYALLLTVVLLMFLIPPKSYTQTRPYSEYVISQIDTMDFDNAKEYLINICTTLGQGKSIDFGARGYIVKDYNKIKNWGSEEITASPFDIVRFSEWKKYFSDVYFTQDLEDSHKLRMNLNSFYYKLFGTVMVYDIIGSEESEEIEKIIDTIYYRDTLPQKYGYSDIVLNEELRKSPRWIDSIKMTIRLIYPYNIKPYYLLEKDKTIKINGGIIEKQKRKYNNISLKLSGEITDYQVCIDAISNNGNYISGNYYIEKRSTDNFGLFLETIYGDEITNSIFMDIRNRGKASLDKKYHTKEELVKAVREAFAKMKDPDFGNYFCNIIGYGNVRDLVFYIAEGYTTETIHLMVRNKSAISLDDKKKQL